jgi:hypothetical protein
MADATLDGASSNPPHRLISEPPCRRVCCAVSNAIADAVGDDVFQA